MSSFSITKQKTEEEIYELLKNVTLGSVYKDYRKDIYSVKYSGDSNYLSLKFPTLTTAVAPKEGDKFFYAVCSNTQGLEPSQVFISNLDTHLSSMFPDTLVNFVKPSISDKSGVIKLYLPYKDKQINYKKLKIYDENKNGVDIANIKENSTIKVLAYLKQYKRYTEEVIPMWVVEQIQIQPPKKANRQGILKEPKEPENTPKEPEAHEMTQQMIEHHSELEERRGILLEDDGTDSDLSDTDYRTN